MPFLIFYFIIMKHTTPQHTFEIVIENTITKKCDRAIASVGDTVSIDDRSMTLVSFNPVTEILHVCFSDSAFWTCIFSHRDDTEQIMHYNILEHPVVAENIVHVPTGRAFDSNIGATANDDVFNYEILDETVKALKCNVPYFNRTGDHKKRHEQRWKTIWIPKSVLIVRRATDIKHFCIQSLCERNHCRRVPEPFRTIGEYAPVKWCVELIQISESGCQQIIRNLRAKYHTDNLVKMFHDETMTELDIKQYLAVTHHANSNNPLTPHEIVKMYVNQNTYFENNIFGTSIVLSVKQNSH